MTRWQPLAAGARSGRPLVAVVGRPNVGKSTLFNRLAGRKVAIVEDRPGVTRDRHYADADVLGRSVVVIDTGGFDPASEDPMAASIASQVKLAINECDAVVCVLDATAPPTAADREAVALLRRSKRPTIFAANKADSPAVAHEAAAHYRLGLETLYPVSALHGHGFGDLEQALVALLPAPSESETAETDAPRIAIVGRPNAGKSSLVNRLLGEERLIVDDRPGTTVDAIDTLARVGAKELVLIDTAGIRRKRAVEDGMEGAAVLAAIRAVERSDAVILLIDADEGIAEQDAKIAGIADARGRAMLVALNKCDLLDDKRRKKAVERTTEILNFASWAPILPISVKSGRGVELLLADLDRAITSHRKRVSTSEANRFFEEVLERHPPPTQSGRSVRLYYVAQTMVRPPTFAVVTNEPELVHWSYERYIVNQLRKRFELHGTPVRVRFKKKRRRARAGDSPR